MHNWLDQSSGFASLLEANDHLLMSTGHSYLPYLDKVAGHGGHDDVFQAPGQKGSGAGHDRLDALAE